MKFIAVALAAAGLVSAQSLSDIPACAQSCITSAVSNATTCSQTDYKCICDHESALVGSATGCVISACGQDVATGQVLPATEKFCSEVEAGGSVSGSATASASASASGSASGSASASGGSSPTTTSATTTITVTSAAVTSSSMAASNATVTTSSPPSQSSSASAVSTGGAAIMGSVGGLAMVALGALAAF